MSETHKPNIKKLSMDMETMNEMLSDITTEIVEKASRESNSDVLCSYVSVLLNHARQMCLIAGHGDQKYAYEAFMLAALGKDLIFDTVKLYNKVFPENGNIKKP